VPSFDVVAEPLADASADLLVVGAFAPDDGGDDASSPDPDAPPVLAPGADALAQALGLDLAAELVAVGFDGAVGSVVRVPTRGAAAAPTVLVAGLGRRDDATSDHLRQAAAAAAGAAERVTSVAIDLEGAVAGADAGEAAAAITEGVLLGAYRFGAYRSQPRPHQLERVAVHAGGDAEATRAGVAFGEVSASATILARDLVNTPPQDKRPPELAERVAAEFEGTSVEVRILDEQALEQGGYGGLLGVGQGSTAPPRLVELTWAPEGATRHVALVGKGITFDTGGISLKPSTAMETMKLDMAGAAAVAATVRAAAALELPVKVTGLLACAENMPSGTATRVSDVLTIRGGTTVEVINTDAEGRLVLADALVHASELQPDAIIDVATLTGAAAIALGDRIGALMADDDELAAALLQAGERAGEPFWRLPLATEQYGEELKGDIADLKNAGWKGAGTVRAGLFLHEFVGDGIPWAHLDIASVSWTDTARGYLAKGGTGVPVRTLLGWLRG
jgi:leucyl aminopeptidase